MLSFRQRHGFGTGVIVATKSAFVIPAAWLFGVTWGQFELRIEQRKWFIFMRRVSAARAMSGSRERSVRTVGSNKVTS